MSNEIVWSPVKLKWTVDFEKDDQLVSESKLRIVSDIGDLMIREKNGVFYMFHQGLPFNESDTIKGALWECERIHIENITQYFEENATIQPSEPLPPPPRKSYYPYKGMNRYTCLKYPYTDQGVYAGEIHKVTRLSYFRFEIILADGTLQILKTPNRIQGDSSAKKGDVFVIENWGDQEYRVMTKESFNTHYTLVT